MRTELPRVLRLDVLRPPPSDRLADERVLAAKVAVYAGRNLVWYANDDQLVSKITAARGTSGVRLATFST
jgi:hypothetical protein